MRCFCLYCCFTARTVSRTSWTYCFAFEFLLRMEAIVAILAVVLLHHLAEIMEQLFPPANRGFGIGDGFEEELLGDLLFGHAFPFQELLKLLNIVIAVKGDAIAFAVVASGPACFLVVALKAFGHVEMDHKPNIGFIDTHAKSDGGDDHIDLFHKELVLVLAPDLGLQPGMVGQGLDAVDVQRFGQLFDLLRLRQ